MRLAEENPFENPVCVAGSASHFLFLARPAGLDVANSSLLDEATAAAEAMNLCFSAAHDADKKAKRPPRNKVYVDSRLHPHSKAIMHTRASYVRDGEKRKLLL